MKKKRYLPLLLTATCTVTLLIACGSSAGSATNATSTAASSEAEKAEMTAQTSAPSSSGAAAESTGSEKTAKVQDDDGVIKFGIACPLTGTSATYGELMATGAQIAVDEINKNGGIGGLPVELVKFDDKDDPSEAALVAQRLVDEGDIDFVISHGGSSNTLAAAPIYESAKMPNMAPSSANPSLTEQGYEYFIRYCLRDDRLSPQVIAMLVNNLGIKKIGVIFANNDYGRGNLDAAISTAKKLGAEVVDQETYNPGLEKDFSTIVNKFLAAGVEGVAVYMDHADAGLYFQQAHALGLDVPSVGQSALTYTSMVDLAGADALQNLYMAVTFNPFSNRDIVVKFNQLFDEAYGKDTVPSEPCGNSYDIVNVVKQAYEEGATKENMAQWIKNTTPDKDYTFVVPETLMTQNMSWDANGDSNYIAASIVRVDSDGNFVSDDETIDITGLN